MKGSLMSYRKTILSASIVASLSCFTGWAYADEAAATTAAADSRTQQSADSLEVVEVHGIRDSLKKSLDTKRAADAVVDAITAEDIGKFPSTNVAEAMAQIPGVTVDRRFGQGERISINGTDPSLNLSFLDGHPVAQSAWLYGEQPSRGFDYTLLAPEILGKLEVYKSPEARLPEGSLGGTVLMHTRQPLDLKANTFSGSIGENYNDQSESNKPNASLLYSWKNSDNTFGVAVSAQHYEEKVDRQGEEVFGYSPVSSLTASPFVAAGLANGSLHGSDLIPQEINAAYFQQNRERNSGTINLQFKPNDQLEFDVSGLYIKEKFDNFNQSMYGFTTQQPGLITSLGAASNGIINSGHSCGNDNPGCAGVVNTYLDNQARHSTVNSKGIDLKGIYKGSGWGLTGQVGISKSSDEDNSQAFIEPYYNGGYTWDLHKGIKFDSPAAAANPANWHDGDTPGNGWGGNYATIPAESKDKYAQIDFSKNFDGFFNELQVGLRYADHTENRTEILFGGVRTGPLSTIGAIGLTDILGGFPGWSSDQQHHVQTTSDNVFKWVLGSPLDRAHPDPGSTLNNTFAVDQESEAAYAQLNFGTDRLHGNFGLRFVHTDITSSGYNFSGTPVLPAPAGWYQTTDNSHNNTLPSFNIAYDASDSVVLRGAVAEVIAWAPYNQEAHYTFLNDTTATGTGGNPNLDPYRSVNFDASVEWYFAEQSVLAGSIFYKDILNYITTDPAIERQYNSMQSTSPDTFNSTYVGKLYNCTADGQCDYSITRPQNGGRATVKGFTVSYQQPFGDSGFGLGVNYTYANGTTKSGQALPYNSKNAVNLSPYFEKGPFSARVTYGWRSNYLAGGYVAGAPPASVADYTELDASLGWRFTDQLSLDLGALNLLDEKYSEYLGNKALIAAQYKTGRRYMATLHFQF